jgi:hypothetical protein
MQYHQDAIALAEKSNLLFANGFVVILASRCINGMYKTEGGTRP